MTSSTSSRNESFSDVAKAARDAAAKLATATRATKDAALTQIADALDANTERIVEANGHDIERATANGTSAALIDRLTLTPERWRSRLESRVPRGRLIRAI